MSNTNSRKSVPDLTTQVREAMKAKQKAEARPALRAKHLAKIGLQRLRVAEKQGGAQIRARVLALNAEDLNITVEKYSEMLKSVEGQKS